MLLPQLKEQGVYNISNFKIVPGPASYRSVDMDMAINFFYKTIIEETEDNQTIPHYKFELQPFDKVQGLVGQIKNLIGKQQKKVIICHNILTKLMHLLLLRIDVVGMVTSIGRLEKRTNGAEKMDVALTDSRYS